MRKAAATGRATRQGICCSREYHSAAREPALHKTASTVTYARIGPLIVALGFLAPGSSHWLNAADPPPNLARLVAQKESEAIEARANFMYRQTVIVEEYSRSNVKAGDYREVRDVIFSPGGERTEPMVQAPINRLVRLRLTDEDFRDIREVQPFLFTKDLLWLYETRTRGEEMRDGVLCWVLSVKPRQTFEGQRLFEGDLWVDQSDLTIVQSTGRAVPDIYKFKQENLFPVFTTFRERVDGGHRFPAHTSADDVLAFSSGPLRMRMTIRYSNYRRFGAESSVRFDVTAQQK
jgi:hypothetical protein